MKYEKNTEKSEDRIMLKIILYLFVFYSVLFTWSEPRPAYSGVFSTTVHGDKINGVMRDTNFPRGSCGQCHASSDTRAPLYEYSLWMNNDNILCFTCHGQQSVSGIYPGQLIYDDSNHSTDSQMIWPGPVPSIRMELNAAGKCLNCHNPHGKKDDLGLIPGLAAVREENLCLGCHSGSPALKNIAFDFMNFYSHPTKKFAGRHKQQEDGNPDNFAFYPGDNRHSECIDCHNPHAVSGDLSRHSAPAASNKNKMVSGVKVFNGAAGTIPSYTYRLPRETGPALAEYEICFKCHSSWTEQPPDQDDMAKLFNTNNPSYHPVEAAGRNLNINAGAFVNGLSATRLIYCTDCHSSDNPDIRAPHGSRYENILKRSYQATTNQWMMSETELCFECHNFDTYANDLAGDTVKGYSRWNKLSADPDSEKGHTVHVGNGLVTCYSCHDSHGSVNNTHLINTRRRPGIVSFSEQSNGGTCSSSTSCHFGSASPGEPKSYVVNYAR